MGAATETFYAKNRQQWRDWLMVSHQQKEFIWLIYDKKNSNASTVSYRDAVVEALCFGWIDSTTMPLDDRKFIQYFCRRKVKRVWSRINQEKIERLVAGGG